MDRLKQIVAAGRAIVHEAHEVSYLMLRARKLCRDAAAEAFLVEALALHQMLVNRVIKLLREAESVLADPPTAAKPVKESTHEPAE